MSYCRFRNTVPDLLDCLENMDETPADAEEIEARNRLIKLCVKIAEDYGEELNEGLN